MEKSLKEIARLIDGKVTGDENILIKGVAGIKEASEGDITFLANPKYAHLMETTRASAVIAAKDLAFSRKPLVLVNNPSLAFAKVASTFSPCPTIHPKGIDPAAAVGKNVLLGKDVAIGPYAVVEDSVSIGEGAVIYSGCFVGHDSKIGKGTVVYPNVSIRERVIIGERVIIHSGTVIGSDGFGYETINGKHQKIPQTGTVEIGDDVEIGANVTIDRARFNKTIIGSGTKIDNLVQIAHNVVIGENSIIVAQVGISGSTTVGKNVTLAGQVGVVGHIDIGDGTTVMAQAGVTKSLPAGISAWGTPARAAGIARRITACIHNLPKLFERVDELKKKIDELEEKLKWKNKGP